MEDEVLAADKLSRIPEGKGNIEVISVLESVSETGRSPSIPAELMMGNKHGAVNVVFNKGFSESSRHGLFHLNTVQFGPHPSVVSSFGLFIRKEIF